MKSIRSTMLVAGISASLLSLSHAQPTTTARPEADFRIVLQALETVPPLPASASPRGGMYYSFQYGLSWPPMPANFLNLPFWDLGDRRFVVDDRSVNYSAMRAEADAEAALAGALTRFT